MGNPNIILVEDDKVIVELLEYNLKNNGFDVASFYDGQHLFSSLPTLTAPALFILDVMLPGMNGFEICSHLRSNQKYENIPILMLTARSTENDKVTGLVTGADDYLTKPFGMRELLARIHALIRRFMRPGSLTPQTSREPSGQSGQPGLPGQPGHPGQMACQNIILDGVRHRVYKDGQEIETTKREYELLKFLMSHAGVAFSRDELLDMVWGYGYGGETRTVDVHIRQLRRKLEKDDANPTLIETVRGHGYRFTDQC